MDERKYKPSDLAVPDSDKYAQAFGRLEWGNIVRTLVLRSQEADEWISLSARDLGGEYEPQAMVKRSSGLVKRGGEYALSGIAIGVLARNFPVKRRE